MSNMWKIGEPELRWWQKLKWPKTRTQKLEEKVAALEKQLVAAQKIEFGGEGGYTLWFSGDGSFHAETGRDREMSVEAAIRQIAAHVGLQYSYTPQRSGLVPIPKKKKK